MNLHTLATSALTLAAFHQVAAQYAPPPPPVPFPGFLNDYLRKQDPYLSVWDIGGTVRLRYEVKENGMGLPQANDFRGITTAVTRNDNSYFSDKVLARIGYTDQWWGAYVEARSSSSTGDLRNSTGANVTGPGAGPESDGPVDLHQAYLTLGNHKEFPLSLKVGRQELSYGDERLVGAFAWNNLGRVFDAAKVRWQNAWFAAEAFSSRLVLPDDNNFNTWNDYNYLGAELDFVAGYALNKFTAIEAGYGHFVVGDYIEQTWSNAAFGSQDADWIYVQTVVRF